MLPTAAAATAVRGWLVTPGLCDPHLHPDKAFALERQGSTAYQSHTQDRDDTAPPEAAIHQGGVGSAPNLHAAIAQSRAQKTEQTAEGIYERSVRLLSWCVELGTTRARLHAEVDPWLGLRSVEGVLAARDALRGRMHLQVVAFAQEGICSVPGTYELLRQAIGKLGCDAVGAITYQDPDPRQHLQLCAELAREFNTPLDVHADFSVPPGQSALGVLADVVEQYGLHGRVLAGHCTTLAAMDSASRARTLARLRDAGIAVCVLPRTDLFIDGHVAPLEEIRAAGAEACLGTNNVMNAFTPVGRPSLPSAAAVYALAAQQGSKHGLTALGKSLWQAARVIGAAAEIAPGAPADLCVWPVHEPWQIVATEAEPLAVYVGGQLVLGGADQIALRGRRSSSGRALAASVPPC